MIKDGEEEDGDENDDEVEDDDEEENDDEWMTMRMTQIKRWMGQWVVAF